MRYISPYRFLLPFAVLLLAAGCSQEKDAFLNRSYHRLTARDNGWFNANEKLKEVVTGIEDEHIDDFDHVLPLFVYGTVEQANAAKPSLETCIDKCSLVIERHSMDIGGEEKNAWIDDAWFVIAKSQFYKRNFAEADRGFTYLTRRFKGQDREFEGHIWAARTAIEQERFAKAQSDLDKVRDTKKLPKRFDHSELSAVQADLDLKRGKVDDAILHLEHSVSITKRKRDRVRRAFILAQLYQQKNMQDKAIKQYAAVVRMNPPYELAFHAQIFQSLAFAQGDSKGLRQKLKRMLRDEKHVDHFDMIHYALAELDLKERDKPSAIDHLETSARVSTTDTKQKAKTFLRLADVHFDDRDYAKAQPYYDSTRTLMMEDHPRFREVEVRAEVLGTLVEQMETIALEDSLQALAQLDERELDKRIRGMIRDRERAEDDKERMEAEARERAENQPEERPAPTVPGGPAGRGSWYFYDAQQISRGLAQFRKKWGNRSLEDNWRRKDKSGSALAESLEGEGEEALAQAELDKLKGQEEWRDPAFYTKDIPRDDEAIAASNERICSALYVSGMIYKEQLKDKDNATESFENLHSRFDQCRYTPEAYYQLYRIYKEKEEAENFFSMDGKGSQYYADIILERYPSSEFARLVRDPNLLQADDARKASEELDYKEVYRQFRQYAYSSVITASTNVIDTEPNNHFRAKYYMLRAMATGGMRDLGLYRAALIEVSTNFPGTDEAKAAEELIAVLDRSKETPGRPAPAEGTYKADQGQHYFAVIVPNKGNDINDIKAKLADFNTTFFRQPGMQITNSFLDADNQVILLTFFETKEKAMEFYGLYRGDRNALKGINDQGHPAFAISPDNYSTLYKNKDVGGYSAFFTKNYLGDQ